VHLIVSILLNFCCCLRLLTLALPFPLELSRTAGDFENSQWGRRLVLIGLLTGNNLRAALDLVHINLQIFAKIVQFACAVRF